MDTALGLDFDLFAAELGEWSCNSIPFRVVSAQKQCRIGLWQSLRSSSGMFSATVTVERCFELIEETPCMWPSSNLDSMLIPIQLVHSQHQWKQTKHPTQLCAVCQSLRGEELIQYVTAEFQEPKQRSITPCRAKQSSFY